MTNFEKIKNMTKEELAAFLEKKTDCYVCDIEVCATYRNCRKSLLEWLGAEAKEEK